MTMKQPNTNAHNNNSSSGTKQGFRNFGRNRNQYNQGFNGNKGGPQSNNRQNQSYNNNRQADDNANFIEYVRNQEKKNSW